MNPRHPRRLPPIALAGMFFLLAAGASLLWPAAAHAQEGTKKAPPAAAPSQPAQLVMPDAERIVLLVRTSLLTLNDALQTGNFTVLRDVAAPSFSQANSAARLASIFGNLTKQAVDLTAIAIIVPQLTEPPILDQQNKMLRIKGFFPGQPVRIDFDVIYHAVEGRWRLFGLSVQPTHVPPAAGLPATTPKAPDQAKKADDAKGNPPKK